MRICTFLLLFAISINESSAQKVKIYSAENGLTLENEAMMLGGTLKKSTSINGVNMHSFNFANLGNFDINSNTIQLNSATRTSIVSATDMNLSSRDLSLSAINNILLNAGKLLSIGGEVRFEHYKNIPGQSLVLSVDETGKLKLVPQQATTTLPSNYSADNGLTLSNNFFSLGGSLNKSTSVNGNNQNLRFTNLDTFFLGGRHVQFINSTKKTTISSFDSLNLLSFGTMLLSSKDVILDGNLKLTGYKNSSNMDSILTVDSCGNLKLVSQKSLQTIAQNAFMNGGNAFAGPAVLGTTDNNALSFKTNNIVRGNIDASGVLNYFGNININNSKLKTLGDIEINGSQPLNTGGNKATNGINFINGGEGIARGTISFNSTLSSMNYTAHGALRFYSSIDGVPATASFADLTINADGRIVFGGEFSRNQQDELSAAYHFKSYFAASGAAPKGILFPGVANAAERDKQSAPALGLIFYNRSTNDLEIYKPDGWHKFNTTSVNATTPIAATPAATESVSTNSNSYVQALGDGQQKTFKINHNLNAQFVMVQFIDCGPEANCNLLQIIPKGARVELDGKNNAQVTFEEAPSFQRYKIMFLRVQ